MFRGGLGKKEGVVFLKRGGGMGEGGISQCTLWLYRYYFGRFS